MVRAIQRCESLTSWPLDYRNYILLLRGLCKRSTGACVGKTYNALLSAQTAIHAKTGRYRRLYQRQKESGFRGNIRNRATLSKGCVKLGAQAGTYRRPSSVQDTCGPLGSSPLFHASRVRQDDSRVRNPMAQNVYGNSYSNSLTPCKDLRPQMGRHTHSIENDIFCGGQCDKEDAASAYQFAASMGTRRSVSGATERLYCGKSGKARFVTEQAIQAVNAACRRSGRKTKGLSRNGGKLGLTARRTYLACCGFISRQRRSCGAPLRAFFANTYTICDRFTWITAHNALNSIMSKSAKSLFYMVPRRRIELRASSLPMSNDSRPHSNYNSLAHGLFTILRLCSPIVRTGSAYMRSLAAFLFPKQMRFSYVSTPIGRPFAVLGRYIAPSIKWLAGKCKRLISKN